MDEIDKFLLGKELADGWVVESVRHVQKDEAGACRSYIGRNRDGRLGFVKVLDPRANGSLEEAQQQLGQFVYERRVTDVCAERNMRRVVRGLSRGEIKTPPPFSMNLHYLVLEWADRDVRSFLDPDEKTHLATMLRWLHHTVTALAELHYSEIVHQDLRPANVVVMPNLSAKVGGLSRSFSRTNPCEHSVATQNPTYRAPELLYGALITDLDRKFAADMYAFGSLVYFMLSGMSLNADLSRALDPMHHWRNWKGSYTEALPYVISAFDDCISTFSSTIDVPKPERLVVAVRELCSPDPAVRGHPANIRGNGARYGMERYISLFDLLASQAEWAGRRAS
jgi:serine/threonine protein kinase